MSLIHRLDLWADRKGSVPAFVFLNKEGQEKERISFRELRNKALCIAGSLRERTKPQERVVLFFSPGLEFITAFLGCLYAGVIAVPIPPPQSKRQLARSIPILDNAKPSLILALEGLGEGFDLPKLSFEEALGHDSFEQDIFSNLIACLQYTSGSTSRPKGVILTHEHLFHQQKIIEEAFQHTEDSKILGWLPFYHDMGLIGNILQPLYLGVTCTLMAPLTFMQSPFIWLEAISRVRATTSGGPNFAYQLCSSKISDEDLAKLDLSSWTLAYNGAERVQRETMRTFAKKFGSCGFREEAFFPCYGMAETTLYVTGRRKIVSTLFTTPDGGSSNVVNCGSTIQGETVLIVDPETGRPRPDKSYGEIWVAGKSVAGGYWDQPEETEKTFRAFTLDGQGPFLRTGDLGFLENGELFVLGRLKNMVILRGKNYFPHDLEIAVVKAHSALAGLQGAAFSIEGQEGEDLVIVQEIPRHIKDPQMVQELFQNIKKSLALEFTIAPVAIVFVVQNSLPRTTSGKIQYFQTRKNFQDNTLSTMFLWERGANAQLSTDLDINPFVQKLAQLLQIHPSEISLDAPIINLGLDSLSGVQFLTWIEEEYGRAFDLPYLLGGATLEQIQDLCTQARVQPKELKTPRSEFPLSANQENVWVSSKLQSSPTAYNISFAVRVMGPFNPDAFRKALGDVMQRHAVFRTHFISKASRPVQVVSEHVAIPFEICDDEGLDNYPFDLTKAPLFKVAFQKRETDSVLFFHFHHLIFDGWSVEILFRELEEAYQGQLQGTPLSWTPLLTRYDSFVEWQQELFQSSHYPSIEHNWKKRLEASEYPVLKISPFTPIAAIPNVTQNLAARMRESSREKTFTIHPQVWRKIKEFASQQKVTPSIVLMSAFHAILHLYTGEKELYVGFPSANRPRADFQKMIGFFVNTLVCKTQLGGSDTFLTLIQQVKECVWTDAKETAYPLQHLLRLLHPPRVVNSSPLFQTMFVMQNAPTSRSHFHDCNIEFLPIKNSSPLYDLVLEMQQTQEGLNLVFEYKCEKIPGAFVEELGRAFGQFLEQAIEHPEASLEAHNLLADELRVIDLFEQRALEYPQKVAIFSDQGNYTYEQLHQAILKIASTLVEAGIKASEPVGLCLEREPLLIASIFAILKAGGAYVPIDPTYPTARCEAIVKDANLRFIIASEKGTETLSFFQGTLFNPKTEAQRTNISAYFPRPKDQLAYILYTSGSTGAPKGVMVGCKNLLNFSQSAIDFFNITLADNVLQFSSICWDTSSEEIYPPLLTGASLVLRGEGRVESFETLLERTEKHQVSFWDLPSSYWHDLVDLLERKKIALPSSLRLVVVGGERVNRSKVQLWCEKVAPEIQLLNTYGATEATSISAVFDLSKWSPEWEDIPIGHAIQNVQLYILNSRLTPVPPGMPGDLYIGGAGVARGYLNLEQLTAERFIRHPKTHEILYRTGDVALTALTGEILLRGRNDRQIKRRGFRIEVEEIEKTLASFAGVETALVLLKGALIGYVVPAKDVPLSPAQLKEFCKKKLPEYMIPDQLYLLSEIPRLHNGKIDQLWLDTFRIHGQESIAQEIWSTTEEKVLSVWKEVLSLESIGKEESFFDVGGHSLLLIKLHEKLQETFSIQLDISTLFAHYTIASQAQKIEFSTNKSTNKSKLELLKQLASGSIDSAEAYLQLKNFQ